MRFTICGSTKIPYIKEAIQKHYCITDKLKELTIFEPDLSVSAGAAFVANANGYSIEDDKNNILIDMNASYVIDNKLYLSGKIVNGDIDKVSIILDEEIFAKVEKDKTFVLEVDSDK